MATHELRVDDLFKFYDKVAAVDGVTLDVPGGDFLTLLGPSGSGKTTILMAIAGFVEPSRGEILLDGKPITHLPPERRNFGMVFQGYALFPHLKVGENVATGPEVEIVDPRLRIEGVGAFGDPEAGWYWRGNVPPDLAAMQAQHDALVQTLEAEGVEVVMIDRAAPGKMKTC